MNDQHSRESVDSVEKFGFPLELSSELELLIQQFGVEAMHADEQALFFLELGRLVQDEYLKTVAHIEKMGGGVVPPYQECASATIRALIESGRR